ncbi:hypothetical protein EJ03DRAFT_174806 [Teratosphaeria nubilosa]|uniref:Uncharacterized protein n=1 Tax=Teratosphaeria nubilosa TaxID=161662 RepID=A0A6G1L141_9PEZI|nr:hypothetical protein EJ03DRAFT_174806 [Teratosphaeria nubilosa]
MRRSNVCCSTDLTSPPKRVDVPDRGLTQVATARRLFAMTSESPLDQISRGCCRSARSRRRLGKQLTSDLTRRGNAQASGHMNDGYSWETIGGSPPQRLLTLDAEDQFHLTGNRGAGWHVNKACGPPVRWSSFHPCLANEGGKAVKVALLLVEMAVPAR